MIMPAFNIYIACVRNISFFFDIVSSFTQTSAWWEEGRSTFISPFCYSSGQKRARIKPDVRMVDQHRAQYSVCRAERRSGASHVAPANSRTRGARTPAQPWRPLLSQTVPRSPLSGRYTSTPRWSLSRILFSSSSPCDALVT